MLAIVIANGEQDIEKHLETMIVLLSCARAIQAVTLCYCKKWKGDAYPLRKVFVLLVTNLFIIYNISTCVKLHNFALHHIWKSFQLSYSEALDCPISSLYLSNPPTLFPQMGW